MNDNNVIGGSIDELSQKRYVLIYSYQTEGQLWHASTDVFVGKEEAMRQLINTTGAQRYKIIEFGLK